MTSAPTETKNSDQPTMNFEQSLEELQKTVKRLESGELPLEEALRLFENGVRLTRQCQEHLTVAEQRVEQLLRIGEGGKPETQPFSGGNQRS